MKEEVCRDEQYHGVVCIFLSNGINMLSGLFKIVTYGYQ